VQDTKFGDNDTLSAHIAALADADYLFLLTDVDGLYTGRAGDVASNDWSIHALPMTWRATSGLALYAYDVASNEWFSPVLPMTWRALTGGGGPVYRQPQLGPGGTDHPIG
jgi:hypothetical protein